MVIVHVVIENSIANAEFEFLQELWVVHDIQAVEYIKASAILHQIFCVEKCVLHDFTQFVRSGSVVIQISNVHDRVIVVHLLQNLRRKIVERYEICYLFLSNIFDDNRVNNAGTRHQMVS